MEAQEAKGWEGSQWQSDVPIVGQILEEIVEFEVSETRNIR